MPHTTAAPGRPSPAVPSRSRIPQRRRAAPICRRRAIGTRSGIPTPAATSTPRPGPLHPLDRDCRQPAPPPVAFLERARHPLPMRWSGASSWATSFLGASADSCRSQVQRSHHSSRCGLDNDGDPTEALVRWPAREIGMPDSNQGLALVWVGSHCHDRRPLTPGMDRGCRLGKDLPPGEEVGADGIVRPFDVGEPRDDRTRPLEGDLRILDPRPCSTRRRASPPTSAAPGYSSPRHSRPVSAMPANSVSGSRPMSVVSSRRRQPRCP